MSNQFAIPTFGTEVSFQANLREVNNNLQTQLGKLERESRDVNMRLAKSEGELRVARSVITALRAKLTPMDAQEYDRSVALEEQAESLKSETKAKKKELAEAHRSIKAIEKELADSRKEVTDLAVAKGTLEAALAAERKEKEILERSVDDINNNLAIAWADLKTTEQEKVALERAKDDVETKLQESQLECTELHAHLQDSQDHIGSLEQRNEEIGLLQNDISSLHRDIEDLQATVAGSNREIQVKDTRIRHLETLHEKAIRGQLNAEAAARAAAAASNPVFETPIYDRNEDSLADELAELATGDYNDDVERLSFSGDTETIATEPAPLQTLSFSAIYSISVEPKTPRTSSIAVQTETRVENSVAIQTEAHVSNSAATQTESVAVQTPPTLQIDISSGVTTYPEEPQKLEIHISPGITTLPVEQELDLERTETADTFTQTDEVIVLAERSVGAAATQTDITGPITVPGVMHHPEPTQTSFKEEKEKPGRFWTLVTFFFACLSLLLFLKAQDSMFAQGYGTLNGPYAHGGVTGRGRHVLGLFPLCFDTPDLWLTKSFCHHFGSGVTNAEKLVGIGGIHLW